MIVTIQVLVPHIMIEAVINLYSNIHHPNLHNTTPLPHSLLVYCTDLFAMPRTAEKTLHKIAQDEKAKQVEKLFESDDDDDDNFELVDLSKPRPSKEDSNSSGDSAQSTSVADSKNIGKTKTAHRNQSTVTAGLDSESTANTAAATPTCTDNNDERQKTAALEEKARQRVARDEDSLVIFHTKKIGHDIHKLFWQVLERSKRKQKHKTTKVYPCRACHPDESMHQSQDFCLADNNNNNKTIVSFLGGGMRGAGQLQQLPNRQLEPMVDPVTGSILESRMAQFLQSIRSQKEYKADPLKLLIQKYALEAIVQKCQQQQQQAKGTAASSNSAATEGSAVVTPKQVSPAALVSQEPADNHSSTGEDCCELEWGDDDDDHPTRRTASANYDIDDPQRNTKQTIRQGCIIEYDQPLSVAGTDVRTAKVARVTNHRKSDFVLELEGGDPLQRDDRVKLVKKMHRKKLIDNDRAKFQAISEYKLINTKPEEDTVDAHQIGIRKKVAAITKHREDFARELKANPETAMLMDIVHPTGGSQKKKRATKKRRATLGPANTNKSVAVNKTKAAQPAKAKRQRQSLVPVGGSKKAAVPSKSTSADAASFSITEAWWNKTSICELTDKSNKIKATLLQDSSNTAAVGSSTRRTPSRKRQSHHMSVDQLDMAVQTRQSLETIVKHASSSGHYRSVDAILAEDIVIHAETDVDGKKLFTLSQVQKFLSGDPDKLVSDWGLDLIHSGLKDWLQKVDHGTTGRTTSPRNLPKVSGRENNTNDGVIITTTTKKGL